LPFGNNPSVVIGRTVADASRIGKFLLTPQGIGFLVKQTGLQLLNTKPETRIYHPLSLLSIVPTVNIPRHLDTGILETIGGKLNETYIRLKDSEIGQKLSEMGGDASEALKNAFSPLMDKANEFLPKKSPIHLKSKVKSSIGVIKKEIPDKLSSGVDKVFPSLLPARTLDSLETKKSDVVTNIDKYSSLAYGHLNGDNAYITNEQGIYSP